MRCSEDVSVSGCRHDVAMPGNCQMSQSLRQRSLNVTKWRESSAHRLTVRA